MVRVDEVCKRSCIFLNPSTQPGHECSVIIGLVSSCYGLYSLLLLLHQQSKSPYLIALYKWLESTYLAVREGNALFNIIFKPRMFWLGILPKETGSCLFNLVYLKMFQQNCQKWDVWARHDTEGGFIQPIQPF